MSIPPWPLYEDEIGPPMPRKSTIRYYPAGTTVYFVTSMLEIEKTQIETVSILVDKDRELIRYTLGSNDLWAALVDQSLVFVIRENAELKRESMLRGLSKLNDALPRDR
jgi:hypothetical protein